MKKEYDVGVIIGRFQVHKLHTGHEHMVGEVLKNHKKVIIFLGVSHVLGTRRNPLDYRTRELMIKEKYGNKVTVQPIRDVRDDKRWSKILDDKISDIDPIGSILLYGSRDSFIPHYKGQFDIEKLEPGSYVSSGTEIREHLSKEVQSSEDFRAGIIYAAYNNYSRVDSVVDVAILNPKNQVLLGRKPFENKFRFIGGFSDVKDNNDIMSCRREVREETGCEVDGFEFIDSFKVSDWRYKGEIDRIVMTRFYKAYYQFGKIDPNDDVEELFWFDLNTITENDVVEEHCPLLNKLLENLKTQK